jgi:hypothetical protein
MSESLYRRNPKEGDIINVLKARRQLYNRDYIQTKDGKSASVRNPAWVTLTGYDKSCGGGESKQLPIKTEKIDATYYSGILKALWLNIVESMEWREKLPEGFDVIKFQILKKYKDIFFCPEMR